LGARVGALPVDDHPRSGRVNRLAPRQAAHP
jgi:hypothetical protein